VRGELLEGFAVNDSLAFEVWLLAQRESAHRQVLQALDHLANHYEARGLDEQALHYVQRQIKMEPWREEAHLQAMRLLLRTGQRSAALAQYETCRRVMAQELGTAPSREMTSLYGSIRVEGANADAQAVDTGAPSNLPANSTDTVGLQSRPRYGSGCSAPRCIGTRSCRGW
jgi:DNA-binding SARP family transcriptional activator